MVKLGSLTHLLLPASHRSSNTRKRTHVSIICVAVAQEGIDHVEVAYQEIDERIELHLEHFEKLLERVRENYRNQILQAKQDARVRPNLCPCQTWSMHHVHYELAAPAHKRAWTEKCAFNRTSLLKNFNTSGLSCRSVRASPCVQAYVEGAIERWGDASDDILKSHQALEQSKQVIGMFSSAVSTGRY